MSALALVISLVTVRVALPYVTEWLKNDTPVYESIRQGMADAVGLDGILDGVLDIGEGTGGNGAGIGERRTIEELKLPEQMKRILIENNNREVYQMLGVEQFGDYVGGYLADTVIKAAASILLFAVVFILLHIVAAWAGSDRKASYNKRTQPDRRSLYWEAWRALCFYGSSAWYLLRCLGRILERQPWGRWRQARGCPGCTTIM